MPFSKFNSKFGTVTTTHLDRDAIKEILPHREPFLFVDAVTEVEPGKRIVGELHADRSKFFFERTELVPSTLLTEAMAQVGAILVLYPEEHRGRTIYFRSIKACSFEAPIPIGSKVKIEAEVKKMRGRFGSLSVTAYLDDVVAATGVMSFALE